jgi:hypothetical protein
VRGLASQHDSPAIIEHGAFDVEWNLSALRVEDIRYSRELSAIDLTFE